MRSPVGLKRSLVSLQSASGGLQSASKRLTAGAPTDRQADSRPSRAVVGTDSRPR
eukprot:gene5004-15246_t